MMKKKLHPTIQFNKDFKRIKFFSKNVKAFRYIADRLSEAKRFLRKLSYTCFPETTRAVWSTMWRMTCCWSGLTETS